MLPDCSIPFTGVCVCVSGVLYLLISTAASIDEQDDAILYIGETFTRNYAVKSHIHN